MENIVIHINPRGLKARPQIIDIYVSSYHLETQDNYFEVVVVWRDDVQDPAPITYSVQYKPISDSEWITVKSGINSFYTTVVLGEVDKYLYGNIQELEFRVVRDTPEKEASDPFLFSFPPALLNYYKPDNRTQLKYEMSKTWDVVIELNNSIYYGNYGENFVLLSRKMVGEKCTCWNELTHRSENPYCRVCYGTGIVGGYEPYTLQGLFQMQRTYKVDPQQQGYEYVTREIKLFTLPYPPIKSNDYIIRQDGTFYRVGSVTRARPSGIVVHQEIQLMHTDPNDPITRYPYQQYLYHYSS